MTTEKVKYLANKTLLVALVLYFTVIGYLVEEVVEVKTLEPYGVNFAVYSVLLVASETVLTVTIIAIFAMERSAWPPYAKKAVESLKELNPISWVVGIFLAIRSAWNISLLDLRLTSRTSVLLGRLNRLSASIPLLYVLIAGLAGLSKIGILLVSIDLGLTLLLWLAMEAFVIEPRYRLFR